MLSYPLGIYDRILVTVASLLRKHWGFNVEWVDILVASGNWCDIVELLGRVAVRVLIDVAVELEHNGVDVGHDNVVLFIELNDALHSGYVIL